MLILDATTRSLEIDLNAVVAANQLPFVASYVDMAKGTVEVIASSSNTGASNSTTAVTLVAAPTSANFTRHLKYLSIRNADTAAVLLWIQVNDNATLREIWKGTLAIGDSLIYTDALGFNVLDTNGRIKVGAGVSGPGATTDNALVRWDGTGGTNTQNSAVIVDDSNNVTGVVALTVTGIVTLSGTAANMEIGANFISYGGTDAGFSLDSGNNATLSGNLTGVLGSFVAANKTNANEVGTLTVYSTDAYAIDKGGSIAFWGKYNSAGNYAAFGRIYGSKLTAADGAFTGYIGMSISPGGTPTEEFKLTADGLTLSGTLTVSGAGPHIFTGNVGAGNFYINATAGTIGVDLPNNDSTIVFRDDSSSPAYAIQMRSRGAEAVRIVNPASADRYITLTGSAGGNPTIGVSAGSLAITPAVVMAAGLTVTGLAGTGTRTVVVDANGVMSAP